MKKGKALGKGLSALIPDVAPVTAEPTSSSEVSIDLLTPNTYQPRISFDEERLADLAQSIRVSGIIQPIVVRREGERFHIIAGERRWRAAKLAGLTTVPVVVKDLAASQGQTLLELALIENLQRENLNPIDQALGFRRLADEFQLTQDAIAAAVHKDRATVANFLRLLRLPEDLRGLVASGAVSMGHARAILSLPTEAEQRALARAVVDEQLSVREVEARVKSALAPKVPATAAPPEKVDVHTRAAEDRLKLKLGTRVRIVRRGTKGRIEIDFGSEHELIRIFDQLAGED